MQNTVVLYPAPGMGHMVSMVELGKLLLRHYHHQFSITILLTTGFWDTNGVTSYINKVSQANPSIYFRRFPSISVDTAPTRSPAAIMFDFIRLHAPNVLHSLQDLSKTFAVRAFVIDLFCTSALPLGRQLKIPTYYFYTSGAAALAAFFHFPMLDQQFATQSYKDLTTTVLHFPAAVPPPLRAIHVPEPFLDRDDQAYHDLVYFCSCLALSDGIIVNTFDDLEPIALKVLAEGKCLLDKPTPPIYCLGPLIAESEARYHHCLSWLDTQPKQSVVFLCFGSRGSFAPDQTKEIARGLEKSGQRFLWVVKSPPFDEKRKQTEADVTNFELEALLPEGFLERVKDRGMVVKSWAPQIQVLNHGSVGGFVTHCGWNSVLETVVAGVPMVAWPLYAEQHLNRNVLEEMKMAIAVEQREEDGFVSGDEMERRLKELMELDKGKELREKSWSLRDKALAALGDSGSSTKSLANLVQSWAQNT